jgi:hypothetical protein
MRTQSRRSYRPCFLTLCSLLEAWSPIRGASGVKRLLCNRNPQPLSGPSSTLRVGRLTTCRCHAGAHVDTRTDRAAGGGPVRGPCWHIALSRCQGSCAPVAEHSRPRCLDHGVEADGGAGHLRRRSMERATRAETSGREFTRTAVAYRGWMGGLYSSCN